jgi:hypothetical protein
MVSYSVANLMTLLRHPTAFIGDLGGRISHRGFRNEIHRDGNARARYTVWGKLQYNLDGLTEAVVWDAYRENLEIALTHVRDLVDHLDGKTVISADHGNLVGDRLWPIPVKGYAHPGGLRHDALTKVPWFELPYESRRQVASNPPERSAPRPEADEEKLAALGYRS